MKILVIHDRSEVRDQLSELCVTACGEGSTVDVADDYVSAARALRSAHYDLCILDLTLPHNAGRGIPTFEKSADLLFEIHNSPDISTPGDIIGITCDAVAYQRLGGEAGCQLMAVIEENSDGLWRKALTDRINYSIKSYRSRLASNSMHFDFDVCIVTALDKEFSPYAQLLELTLDDPSVNSSIFTFKDKAGKFRRGVICPIGRAGIARAAVKTQAICSMYRPRYILMSGFCGGVKGRIGLGDVALFETVFDWDCGKWTSSENKGVVFAARPEPIPTRDTKIHLVARSVCQSGIFGYSDSLQHARSLVTGSDELGGALRLVSAASGSAVVADDEVVSRIIGLSDSISAVDMESYGVYLASNSNHERRTNVLCIKAVSDFCNGEKHDGLHAACSYLSAACVKSLLLNHIDF